jgi:(p)ppGpp synthase/HD superfamily hydrolase
VIRPEPYGSVVTFTLEDAIALATEAHEGQRDRTGKPFIGHPLRVMGRMSGELERMVAALHDVIEDTSLTAQDLAAAGVPARVVDAVLILTKADDEPYERYLHRIVDSGDPVAIAVKHADIADNSDPERLRGLSEEDRTRLSAKYATGRRILEERPELRLGR